ncbi:MAG: hypothetical protein P0S96_07990 [Simkaniaceae bacterium]|nr:hypothetical protein [Candidatus Sacchlamyda saccharinae]
MSNRRIDPSEGPREERLYASRTQEDKKEKEKFRQLPSEEGKEILLATFFSYLKKMFDTFSPSKKLAGKVIDQQTIIEHLEKFKEKLNQLKAKDLSNTPDFATELSNIWSLLFEDYENISVLERKNLKEVSSFREMMDTIKHYPAESEHRLGYYLLEHAGEDWLPFPFIEILKKLHDEHLEDPKLSTLTNWQALITNVIDGLKKQLPFKIG